MSNDRQGGLNMKVKAKNYLCSNCGNRDVKLWRPDKDTTPLICAECAEKHQIPMGNKKEKSHTFPKWKVNEKGQIPSYHEGAGTTNVLVVSLADCDFTELVPAILNEDGRFCTYENMQQKKELYKWWEELATR